MKLKKLTSAILAIAMTVTSIPSVTAEECLSVFEVMKASGAPSEVKAGEESSAEDFEYEVNEDGESVTLTRYKGNNSDVVIPSVIDGKKVTVIGDFAFSYNDSITSVKIPDSVIEIGFNAFCLCRSLASVNIPNSMTKIGYSAFSGCASLTFMDIPNSVAKIEYSAFNGCTSLTSVNLPDRLTEIGFNVFKNCSSLKSIQIPNSVEEIGGDAFYGCASLTSVDIPDSVHTMLNNRAFEGCSSLKSINVDEKNKDYSSLNGVLFDKDQTLLIQYPAGKEDKSYSIPDSVTDIKDIAFNDCTFLTSVKVPNGLTQIEGFSGCTSLTSINIPDSVTYIIEDTFFGCSSLASITIPNSVSYIGDHAFSGCTSLASINIPNSVTDIGIGAFSNCTSLTSIDIPESVTFIGQTLFSGCSSLKSINVDEKNTKYSSLNGVLFNKDKTNLIRYPACKDEKSYSIPNGVDTISSGAFSDCTCLTLLEMPSSLKTISIMEFNGCSSLKSIEVDEKNERYTSIDGVLFYKDKTRLVHYPAAKEDESYSIPDGVTWIDYRAFNNCSNLISVEIPSSVETIYFHRGFSHCTSLKSIIVDENNESYSSLDGVLFNKNKTALLQYPLGKTDKSYSVPNGVIWIGDEAFSGCNLNLVEIPNSVENININAFSNCSSLAAVIISSDSLRFGDSYVSDMIYDGDVFDNSPALTVYCKENFYIQKYMNRHAVPFKILGKEAVIDTENGIIIENPNLDNKTFEVEKSAESSNNNIIYNITLKDENGNEVQPKGNVTVKILLPEGWDAEKTTVNRRESDGTLTDMKAAYENGYMVFETDHFSEYILTQKPNVQIADLNSDGKITTVDAKWVLQAVSGSRELTPEQIAAADVNGDGKITTVDAKWILQAVSGSRELG